MIPVIHEAPSAYFGVSLTQRDVTLPCTAKAN
jgi:hypothetical protein